MGGLNSAPPRAKHSKRYENTFQKYVSETADICSRLAAIDVKPQSNVKLGHRVFVRSVSWSICHCVVIGAVNERWN